MKILAIFAVISYTTVCLAEETRLLDLAPNDAQNILDKQDLNLNYAPKIDSNVPALRYLGKELHEVLEDIYQARQFHGQDGVGGYVYGYSVPDIAKAEKKNAGGDLKGSYQYVNGQGQEIKVEYWDDGTGFHQTDNLPKVTLEANTDTPEVQAAKDEHFRIWRELAAQNKAAGVSYDQPQEDTRSYDDSAKYAYDESKDPWATAKYVPSKEELEPVKDPKGFFYSFDYPVGIIVDKGRAVSGTGVHKRSSQEQDPFQVQNELYNKNRELLNGALKSEGVKDSRLSLRAANFGSIPVAAVHDAQVPSYLRAKVEDVQKYPVYFHKE